MKNNYTYKLDKPKKVGSDGIFKVGDNAGYGNYGNFQRCEIISINRVQNRYEYEIMIHGREWEYIWASKDQLKKMSKNDWLKKSKYQIGQKVYSTNWNNITNESTIVGVIITKWGDVEYTLSNITGITTSSECDIRINKEDIDKGNKFSIGDLVTYNSFRKDRNIIIGFFKFEEYNTIYSRTTGDWGNQICDEKYLIEYKPVLIIHSEEDPYGEEDWNEN